MNHISKTASMTEGQRAYEARRAAKAGKSLESWLSDKEKLAREAERIAETPTARKKSLITRLLDRAHRPLAPSKK